MIFLSSPALTPSGDELIVEDSLKNLKILVTGGGGQVGRAFARTKPNGVILSTPSRADCDITKVAAVEAAVGFYEPDVIVNFAAFTAVDAAERNREAVFSVNARGAGNVARAARGIGARMIHISTDYVFDGRRSTPYPIDAEPCPVNVYGESKLAGEEAVHEACAGSTVIRSGWIYSLAGKNFLLRMLDLLNHQNEIRVVSDQTGTPTSALDFARVLWLCACRPDLAGTFHFQNSGNVSWYEFACQIETIARELHLINHGVRIIPISSFEYAAPARRPAYSALDSSALLRKLGCDQRNWLVALRDLFHELRAEQTVDYAQGE